MTTKKVKEGSTRDRVNPVSFYCHEIELLFDSYNSCLKVNVGLSIDICYNGHIRRDGVWMKRQLSCCGKLSKNL